MSEIHPENVSDRLVDVGPGVRVPESWDILVTNEPGIPGQVRVRAEYDKALERVVATTVTTERADGGDEVTSLTLREVRVQTYVQHTAIDLVQIANDSTSVPLRTFLAAARKREWNAQEAQAMALVVYRAAATATMPPLKSVAHAFNVSQSTATRLIARTRDAAGPIDHASGPVAEPRSTRSGRVAE